MNLFPAGLGGTTGDSVAVATKYQTTGNVWYVGPGGADAGGNAGKQRLAPLATVAQAVTNAADGDDIVVLAGYTVTTATAMSISKHVRIIGEGAGSSRPRFTRNHATEKIFELSGIVELRNLWFAASAQANTTPRVTIGSVACRVKDCYFESGANDTGPSLTIASSNSNSRIEGTTFISTSTTTAPESAIKFSNAPTDLLILDCIISGGTKGWTNQYALDGSGFAATRLKIENIQLLLDSDIGLHASTTGTITFGTCSGSARVIH